MRTIKCRLGAFVILCAVFLSGCNVISLDVPPESSQVEGTADPSQDEMKTEQGKEPEDKNSENKNSEAEKVVYTYSELKKNMWAKSPVNVRDLPGKEGKILGVLKEAQEIAVTGKCNETGWYRVTYNGQVGYVSDSYLLSENPVEEKPEEPETKTTMYAQDAVHVRTEAASSSKSLGVLKLNEKVTAVGQAKDGWQKVLYNGQTAYVSAKYLASEMRLLLPEITAEQVPIPEIDESKYLVVIDAGHQSNANEGKEPLGPGSSTMKKKVSRGTRGEVSNWWEYELNLVVALKLEKELTARGYQVVMIRKTHDINISNSERAKVANNLNADAFIRIHANGSDNPEAEGAFTICQTSKNPYVAETYKESRRLADCILDGFALSTGCVKKNVWETDTMSGINWANVPVTILEMGYMTNAKEDALMATEAYQDKMVQGIADGVDKFFEN